METTKTFPARVVLTVTTGRLLTERKSPYDNGIGGLYEIINHMTGESTYTHQIPAFAKPCAEYLMARYPELSGVDLTSLDSTVTAGGDVEGWLQGEIERIRSHYEIPANCVNVQTSGPITDLLDMMESKATTN